ncbi:MAG: hypothetical protein OXI87_01715 [Albidovulum sp.]|nr:hypothetical protein [Albidovulum sp.]
MRLSIGPSQVGRKARKVGERVREWELSETAPPDPDASVCGVAVDGTGIPVRKQEVADRAGKQPSPFAQRLAREAERRGYGRSDVQFALGDGGAWIWNTVGELFPDAIQILDLYRVLERISDAAKALAKRWRGMIKSGRLQPVVDELKSHAPRHGMAGEAAACFENNRARMDYPRRRSAGLPVGSGVIEGACRSVVCERLKKSGMFWSVAGANKILALRCAVESNAFDDFWEFWAEEKKTA